MNIRDHFFIKAVTRVSEVFAFFAAFIILAMSVWITYDVLACYFFSGSAPWAFDMSEYALVWITFLAAPWLLLRDGHVRVEIIIDALSPKAQRRIGIVVSIIGLLASAILTWRCGIAAVEYYQGDIMMPRIWRIPKLWPYIAIPIGGVLLVLAFIARLMIYLKSSDPEYVLHGPPEDRVIAAE